MKRFLLLAPVLALSACANVSQQAQARDMSSMNAVCDAASNDPRVAPLEGFIPKNAANASISQLSDQSKISPAQKPAVEAIQPVYAACFDATAAYLNKYYGASATAMYGQLLQELRFTEAALWRGEISYGQFNSSRAKLVTQFMQAAEQSRLQSTVAAQQIEQARLQNALSIMNATRIPVQPYPTTTNTSCYGSGSWMNCTTN